MTSVSLIIPVYNKQTFILRLLHSIQRQTCHFDEIIFVDDASTDESRKIIETWIEENPSLRCTLLPLVVNKGVSFARNTGISFAKSRYIAFTDADDVLEGDACQRIKGTVAKYHREKMFIFQVYDNENKRIRPDASRIKRLAARQDSMQEMSLKDWQIIMADEALFCSGGNVVVSADLESRFNVDSRHIEDWEYYFNVALELNSSGKFPVFVPHVLSTYMDDDKRSASRSVGVPTTLKKVPSAAKVNGLTREVQERVISIWLTDIFDRCNFLMALSILRRTKRELPHIRINLKTLLKILAASFLGVRLSKRIKNCLSIYIS
jgi:glycosyltransferase involved in cell wall biosynthesis